MKKKKIYRLDDKISFRKCALFEGADTSFGDCTNFETTGEDYNGNECYQCSQHGIHYHCSKHPEIELEFAEDDKGNLCFYCPKCNKQIDVENQRTLLSNCLKAANRDIFKDADIFRVDDYYVAEIKQKIKNIPSDYWITADVKTDKDGDTVIVLYIGHKGDKEKIQYFIKPEKAQLSSDHKDLDPAHILAKIEVTLRDRKLTQEFDEEI